MTAKKALVLALVLLLALGAAVPALAYGASWYDGEMYVANCEEYVNLRVSPSTSARSLGRIYRGTEVWVEPYNNTFAHVYVGGEWGYVLTRYLVKAVESYSVNDYMRVVNCDSWVSLRDRPSTSAPRICKVPKGATVYVYRQEDTWYICEYNGMQGYILAKYLTW